MAQPKRAVGHSARRSPSDPDPLQMRVLWEITRHPDWDIENLADALGSNMADIAAAVDALLRSGMLREFAGIAIDPLDAPPCGVS